MVVRFYTSDYVAAHGHSPRGRGLWSFTLGDGRGAFLREPFQHCGTYTEAREAVFREARSIGGIREAVVSP